MAIQYDNFDLLIEHLGDSFRARVLDSPAGEAFAQFQLPYTQSEVENFFVQIGHTRLVETSQMQQMRLFGQELFEATFTGNVRDKFRESLIEVNRKREGLRIRLRISEVPELANLPWEFMYDASLSRFLTLSIETPLVRYLDVPRDIQPLTIHPPLQILAVISSPRDFPTLNVQHEWNNLQEALERLENRGMVKLTLTEKPTLQALQRQLRRGEYHIFHFIGHGVFSKLNQDGQLLFEDEIKGGDPVSSRDLGILLHDHRHLRLAVLNSCEGARTSMEDQFAGTAQSLMLQGLPAVIAMQFRITDIAAITMAREFYAALADGYPVDAALTEARKAIKTHGNELEWGTPVLYMRSPDGAIFDVKTLPSNAYAAQPTPALDTGTEKQLANLYTEGLEAFYLKEWEKAILKFKAITDIQSGYKDVAAKLEVAQKRLKLFSLDEQAKAAEAEGNWEAATKALEILAKEYPEQLSFSERLKGVQKERHLSNLYDEARQLANAEKWSTVVHVFAEIHSQDPQYPDPEGMLARADKAVAAQKLQDELQSLYQNALQSIDDKNWLVAQRHLHQIQVKQDGYRETERLLQTLDIEIERIEKQKEEGDKIASLYIQAENLAHRKQWQKALEKIEDIRKIQPHFEDPKQIAAKVYAEMEKSHLEEEKQNQLAELYAEAVKLNLGGNYQGALEKWKKVRALDPTYPDRQKVQSTAKNALNRLARTEQRTGRSLWATVVSSNWSIFVLGFGWFLTRFGLQTLVGLLFGNIQINDTTLAFITWGLMGIGFSLVYLLAIRLLDITVSKRTALLQTLYFTLSSLLIPIITYLVLSSFVYRWALAYILAGVLFGFIVYQSLKDRVHIRLQTAVFAFGFGMFVGECAFAWLADITSWSSSLRAGISVGVAGLIGASLVFGQILAKNREKSAARVEYLALTFAGILIISRWLSSAIGEFFEGQLLSPAGINFEQSPYLYVTYYFVQFAIYSVLLLIRPMENRLSISLNKKEKIILFASWILGMVITSFLSVYLFLVLGNEWSWSIGWGVGGTLIGLGMWLITKKASNRKTPFYAILSMACWGIGFFLSEYMSSKILVDFFTRIFGDPFGWNIAINVAPGFAGLIGSLFMLSQLQSDRIKPTRWRPTLAVTILPIILILVIKPVTQGAQRFLLNEPFAGAIGEWRGKDPTDQSNISLSIERSFFTGEYTITYVDDAVNHCHYGPARGTIKRKVGGFNLLGNVNFRCDAYNVTTFKLMNIRYEPNEDKLVDNISENRWIRK